MELDPDGQMDVFTFSNGKGSVHHVGTVTPEDCEGYIVRNVVDQVPGWNGGTTYSYLDGNDLPQAPRYIANATLRYAIPVGDAGEVFAYTDWAYRSKINYFLYSAAEFRGRSSLEGGLKVGYKSNHGYEIAAFARNITNQIRAVSAIDFNNLTGMINEPRIIGGMIKASF